ASSGRSGASCAAGLPRSAPLSWAASLSSASGTLLSKLWVHVVHLVVVVHVVRGTKARAAHEPEGARAEAVAGLGVPRRVARELRLAHRAALLPSVEEKVANLRLRPRDRTALVVAR